MSLLLPEINGPERGGERKGGKKEEIVRVDVRRRQERDSTNLFVESFRE